MKFVLLEEEYAICQPDTLPKDWETHKNDTLYSLTLSPEEISLVCSLASAPPKARMEPGWRALKIDEKLDFNMTGILASIAFTLADKGISLFAISTFNTDYFLVKQKHLGHAVKALEEKGHSVAS